MIEHSIQSASATSSPLMLMTDIEKSFPGVRAIKHGHLELLAGEVHALMGENGAGKSTLIKILSGAHRPDAGTIAIDGAPVAIHDPLDSQARGIAVIYQEFNIVPTLSARENIFLGQEQGRGGLLAVAEEHKKAVELFSQLETNINPSTLCRDLSVAQQQVVEIAKALARKARILVMDEPTAVLMISSELPEVLGMSDRILVMQEGRIVGEIDDVTHATQEQILGFTVADVNADADKAGPKVRSMEDRK